MKYRRRIACKTPQYDVSTWPAQGRIGKSREGG